MLVTVVVARAPAFGGEVASFDATAAKAVRGVRDVVQISWGVAVVAEHTAAAIKGRDELRVEWTPADQAPFDSDAPVPSGALGQSPRSS